MPRKGVESTIQAALRELYIERDTVTQAIDKLEGLLAGGRATAGRRGRRALAGSKASVSKPRRSAAGWSAAKRRAAAARMKKYWAAWRKKHKK